MAIKKVGGGGRVSPVEPIENKKPASVEGFAKAAATKESPRTEQTEVARAVQSVAADVAAGRIPDPQDQVDAVIDRMVRLQAPEGASARVVNARVAEVQLALGDHPGFSGRVQDMISKALESTEA